MMAIKKIQQFNCGSYSNPKLFTRINIVETRHVNKRGYTIPIAALPCGSGTLSLSANASLRDLFTHKSNMITILPS